MAGIPRNPECSWNRLKLKCTVRGGLHHWGTANPPLISVPICEFPLVDIYNWLLDCESPFVRLEEELEYIRLRNASAVSHPVNWRFLVLGFSSTTVWKYARIAIFTLSIGKNLPDVQFIHEEQDFRWMSILLSNLTRSWILHDNADKQMWNAFPLASLARNSKKGMFGERGEMGQPLCANGFLWGTSKIGLLPRNVQWHINLNRRRSGSVSCGIEIQVAE